MLKEFLYLSPLSFIFLLVEVLHQGVEQERVLTVDSQDSQNFSWNLRRPQVLTNIGCGRLTDGVVDHRVQEFLSPFLPSLHLTLGRHSR